MFSSGEITFSQPPPQDQNKPNGKVKEAREKLEGAITRTSRVLFKASTIFPFDFFPDDLVIDENMVHVVERTFFYSEQIYSVPLKDIELINVEYIPYFATMLIYDSKFKDKPVVIKYLKKEDALKARHIIQGLTIALDQGVDLSKLEVPDIIKKIEYIGKVKGIENSHPH